MAKNLSGITQVEYASTVGGVKTALTGKIHADSTIEVPNTPSETTVGQIFGGGSVSANIIILDFADYATAQGWMTGDTEMSFTFTFTDASTLETQKLVQPMVERQVQPNARDGVQGWILSFEHYDAGILLA